MGLVKRKSVFWACEQVIWGLSRENLSFGHVNRLYGPCRENSVFGASNKGIWAYSHEKILLVLMHVNKSAYDQGLYYSLPRKNTSSFS